MRTKGFPWLDRFNWLSVAVLVIVGVFCLRMYLHDPDLHIDWPWPSSFGGFVLAHLFPLRKPPKDQ